MNSKERFLDTYDREHQRTMRVLRAYPADQLDLRPTPTAKTARELAWVFVMERSLGTAVWNDAFAKSAPSGKPPAPPEDWDELLGQIESGQRAFREVIAAASDDDLAAKVHFMVGPKQMGEIPRIEWIWFLLFDEIHHRGQFSVYLRMSGAKVPSIYGPSGDEPWI
jgi:uncharacterized damage-inducible protein DinB